MEPTTHMTTLASARHMRQQLRDLGKAEAPNRPLANVCTTVGIADCYFTLETPLGQVYVAFNGHGLSAVQSAESSAGFEQRFRKQFGRAVYLTGEPPATIASELHRELHGDGRARVRFDLRGLSEFERAVLLKALEIPRGEVRPYAWVAREIGNPRAVRAVGTALSNNPVPIFIPCHRVVRSNGQTGEYGLGGEANKRMMLRAEGITLERLEELANKSIRFTGSDTSHIFCFPTCHHVRRVTNAHLVQFHSEAEAFSLGYRPCKVCRPAKGA
jgi:O-6-methylguanine DNA methyltransferase